MSDLDPALYLVAWLKGAQVPEPTILILMNQLWPERSLDRDWLGKEVAALLGLLPDREVRKVYDNSRKAFNRRVEKVPLSRRGGRLQFLTDIAGTAKEKEEYGSAIRALSEIRKEVHPKGSRRVAGSQSPLQFGELSDDEVEAVLESMSDSLVVS